MIIELVIQIYWKYFFSDFFRKLVTDLSKKLVRHLEFQKYWTGRQLSQEVTILMFANGSVKFLDTAMLRKLTPNKKSAKLASNCFNCFWVCCLLQTVRVEWKTMTLVCIISDFRGEGTGETGQTWGKQTEELSRPGCETGMGGRDWGIGLGQG